ncbi:amidoligase family protein (plasmid) [Nonomuraea sp. NBC_00507]|uniref:amidoligase family protein n=1 Tax=Nonomuraea sp. NBC_00507 TaxID=2976002 RepID=UPI002E18F435
MSYLNNPEAFQQAYDEARARRERGEPPISYMYEDATDGLGAREGGRAFGVEIEFDLSGADDDDALEAIARDLYDAGLSRYAYQGGYHSNMREGYSDAPNGWRLESDATVAGEIVSPIMYDEPQTWRNLEKVCEIVRRHGGVATYNTGGHVHVSLHDYDHTIDNHNRLLQLNAAYEDVLFRMAQNPAARQHRGTSWCRPNQVPAGGYRSVQEVSWRNAGHGLGLNLQAVNGGRQDHAEMRMWDGSLDPSVIQTQIKTSLALVAAASRGAEADQPERLGTHRQRNAHLPRGERLRGQAWLDDTRSFRQLMDTIYRRARDKAQATALFASTRWQRPR